MSTATAATGGIPVSQLVNPFELYVKASDSDNRFEILLHPTCLLKGSAVKFHRVDVDLVIGDNKGILKTSEVRTFTLFDEKTEKTDKRQKRQKTENRTVWRMTKYDTRPFMKGSDFLMFATPSAGSPVGFWLALNDDGILHFQLAVTCPQLKKEHVLIMQFRRYSS